MDGTTIGPYRVVRKIGAGGMGAVYLAEHTLVGRKAAIKVLLPEWSARRDIVTRFFNEAKAMSSIPDPGIVQMFDFGFAADGCAYIVMELLEGETLQQRRKRLGRFAVTDALRLTRQVAATLASAHSRGIIHRDLKPENVFIVRDPEALGGERPKLLDFGIAKLSGNPDPSYTLPGQMLGTPVYMSPEQCRGADEVDERSDVYSLGCVMYALVAGRPPFKRVGIGELISAHMNDMPESPSRYAPDIPPEFDALIMHCLVKQRDRRLQSMVELQEQCEALLARYTMREIEPMPHSLVVPLPAGFRSSSVTPPPPDDDPPIPTTLSSAVGVQQQKTSTKTRRVLVTAGAAVCALAVGAAVLIGMTGSSRTEEKDDTRPAAPVIVPATSETPPAPPPPSPPASSDKMEQPPAPAATVTVPVETAPVTTTTKPTATKSTTPKTTTPKTTPKTTSKTRPTDKTPAQQPIDLYEGR
jgi:eukaryotic-like serine/threonine-protein kinase